MVTDRRLPLCLAFALAAVAVCAACGNASTPTARPATASSAGPASTPTATPATPNPLITVPATPITSGKPPVTYTVPADFVVLLATDQEVRMTSQTGAELLTFTVDPSLENTSTSLGTVSIGGETGYILQLSHDDGLYSEVVVVRHSSHQYEIACTGYRGYSTTRLQQGCSSFIGSIRFNS